MILEAWPYTSSDGNIILKVGSNGNVGWARNYASTSGTKLFVNEMIREGGFVSSRQKVTILGNLEVTHLGRFKVTHFGKEGRV